MNKELFDKYIKETEPNKKEKSYAWSTAIGLQAVDGLKPSSYLLDVAVKNIEGEITIEEVKKLIDAYYDNKSEHDVDNGRVLEADKVSTRIRELIAQKTFNFSVNEMVSIHKYLFNEIYSEAGKLRDYNITKKEWVLDGDSVYYSDARELKSALEFDLNEERNFKYKNLSLEQTIHHLALFISRLWQIHPFCEGNTRTTAVFFIKYLHKLGFDVTNDIFADNSWYFRNALVRANYTNLTKNVYETTYFLELFLRNLLLNENNTLRNRDLHISNKVNEHDLNKNKDEEAFFGFKKADIKKEKPDIDFEKPDIESIKPDVNKPKTDFPDEVVFLTSDKITSKTNVKISKLFDEFGYKKIFGRSDVINLLDIKSSRASELISDLKKYDLIEPVLGYGKGKYRFKKQY